MGVYDDIKALLQHESEQDPHLRALATGERTVNDLGLQDALEMLAAADAMQTRLILRLAKEIDATRSASDSGD